MIANCVNTEMSDTNILSEKISVLNKEMEIFKAVSVIDWLWKIILWLVARNEGSAHCLNKGLHWIKKGYFGPYVCYVLIILDLSRAIFLEIHVTFKVFWNITYFLGLFYSYWSIIIGQLSEVYSPTHNTDFFYVFILFVLTTKPILMPGTGNGENTSEVFIADCLHKRNHPNVSHHVCSEDIVCFQGN